MPYKPTFPSAKDLSEIPLLALAGFLLRMLSAQLPRPGDASCAQNVLNAVGIEYDYADEATIAVSEAWGWLVTNGMLCHAPRKSSEWFTLSRKGREAAQQAEFPTWVAAREFPSGLLHSSLHETALVSFRQGRFDTAVFEAFKEVEVSIRTAAGFGPELIGVKLASRAFHPDDGPLTDPAAEAGERTALMNLMTGAIGSYKNPHSHRHVDVEPEEAREMLIMASHLLKIIHSRMPRDASPAVVPTQS